MVEINWTLEADRWLNDIHEFIARDNPSAAAKVVLGIYNKVQMLKEFPEIGYIYKGKPYSNIRILLYGHFRIAYLIKNDDRIDILGSF